MYRWRSAVERGDLFDYQVPAQEKRVSWRRRSGWHTRGLELCVGRRTRVSYSPVPHQRGRDLEIGVLAGHWSPYVVLQKLRRVLPICVHPPHHLGELEDNAAARGILHCAREEPCAWDCTMPDCVNRVRTYMVRVGPSNLLRGESGLFASETIIEGTVVACFGAMRELRKGEVGTGTRIGYSFIVRETGGRTLKSRLVRVSRRNVWRTQLTTLSP